MIFCVVSQTVPGQRHDERARLSHRTYWSRVPPVNQCERWHQRGRRSRRQVQSIRGDLGKSSIYECLHTYRLRVKDTKERVFTRGAAENRINRSNKNHGRTPIARRLLCQIRKACVSVGIDHRQSCEEEQSSFVLSSSHRVIVERASWSIRGKRSPRQGDDRNRVQPAVVSSEYFERRTQWCHPVA